jgi:ADP-ribosylglycohydrolase
MAAAVAEAMNPEADVESIHRAAVDAILPLSGREMLDRIEAMLDLARQCADYGSFRKALYKGRKGFFCRIICDSRETIPLTLALLYLGSGDVERCVIYAANLGRDADTIASMCGAIAGAWCGLKGIRADWVEKAVTLASADQGALARQLADAALSKYEREARARAAFEHIAAA